MFFSVRLNDIQEEHLDAALKSALKSAEENGQTSQLRAIVFNAMGPTNLLECCSRDFEKNCKTVSITGFLAISFFGSFIAAVALQSLYLSLLFIISFFAVVFYYCYRISRKDF